MHRTPPNMNKKYPREVLTDDELHALLEQCSVRTPTGLRSRAPIAVLYRAGLRISEALALRPNDHAPRRSRSLTNTRPQSTNSHNMSPDHTAKVPQEPRNRLRAPISPVWLRKFRARERAGEDRQDQPARQDRFSRAPARLRFDGLGGGRVREGSVIPGPPFDAGSHAEHLRPGAVRQAARAGRNGWEDGLDSLGEFNRSATQSGGCRKPLSCWGLCGSGGGVRTLDLRLMKPPL